MKIYTKTGDSGSTSLYGGLRVPKHHHRIEAYGTLDELNSYMGLIAALLGREGVSHIAENIQNELFVMGSHLAAQPDKENLKLPDMDESLIGKMEQEIDRMDEMLPPLKFFILPGGSALVAHIHVARCICRRAERACTIVAEQEAIDSRIVMMLNRLSDYLFTLARYAAMTTGTDEIPWKTR